MKKKLSIWLTMCVLGSMTARAQDSFTLDQCIDYAMQHKADMERALLDERIGQHEINASLSDWLPQVTADFTLANNLKLPSTAFGDQVIQIGRNYNSNLMLRAEQTLYSNEVLLASKASSHRKQQLQQDITYQKINTVVDVSKAYYDILLTREQLSILNSNIVRQQKQYNDSYNQYENGVVDKTDYQRASITLANSKSAKKRTEEGMKAKTAYLKQLMGFPVLETLNLQFATKEVLRTEVALDTTQLLVVDNRVEFRQLQTDMELLKLSTSYQKMGLIPKISAYANYNPQYFDNSFGDLYSNAFPTSSIGITASIPIFQGNKRNQEIKMASLRESRLEVTMADATRAINTEYVTSLARYKSDYTDMVTLKSNADLAQDVYNTIKLQYDEGIKAYIDVIVAETELQASQLNYLNAVYQLLSSKLDFQKAIGAVDIN